MLVGTIWTQWTLALQTRQMAQTVTSSCLGTIDWELVCVEFRAKKSVKNWLCGGGRRREHNL